MITVMTLTFLSSTFLTYAAIYLPYITCTQSVYISIDSIRKSMLYVMNNFEKEVYYWQASSWNKNISILVKVIRMFYGRYVTDLSPNKFITESNAKWRFSYLFLVDFLYTELTTNFSVIFRSYQGTLGGCDRSAGDAHPLFQNIKFLNHSLQKF
jgi:hypothetical protein